VDPDSGTPIGAGDYVQIIAYSNSPQMGAAPLYIDTTAVPINSGQITMIQTTAPSGAGAVLLDWSLANLTAADVGTSMTFETGSPNVDPLSAKTLSFNATGQEGGDIKISLPSVSTASLNISDLSVMPTETVDFSNQVSGSASNAIPTADAEARVQMAIDAISEVRARVGAQSVSLQEDANDASLEVVNQVASESAIRDVNVGQAATDFIKDQVLGRIDVSVLSQMQVNAQLVIQLVGGASPGTQGRI
jgi:flagellin